MNLAIIKLSDMIVPSHFENHPPHENKILKKKKMINRGQIEHIVLSENLVIKDGYATYIALKELGINRAYAIIDYKTVYVYGRHLGQNSKKEYVWKCSHYNEDKFLKTVKVEDIVSVPTKYGISKIVVTKIQVLDNPPINGTIKTVIKKCKSRKGGKFES